MASSTVEDYLKRIWLEQQRSPGVRISTGQIAMALEVTPGTATSMVKTLADAGLLVYEPYNGVALTPSGTRLAMHVLRRHRLVELFLVRMMGMNWSEVHGEAELLEHAISEGLLERMDEMLGRPQFDPHGDPIPTPQGEVSETSRLHLLDCPLGRPVQVVRVTDQSAGFLRLVERHGLIPGRRLQVEARDEQAGTVRLRPESHRRRVSLGFGAASRIQVEPVGR